ncbi:Gag polyprotein [Bienertia sinuspersici]
MIEVNLNQELLESIEFENEMETDVVQAVSYEWKPTLCSNCHKLGHIQEECRKQVVKEWRPKQQKNQV